MRRLVADAADPARARRRRAERAARRSRAAAGPAREAGRATILTPHDGEYTRLVGEAPGPDRIAAARRLADATDAVVLLKGPTTVIAEPGPDGRVAVNPTGGPGPGDGRDRRRAVRDHRCVPGPGGGTVRGRGRRGLGPWPGRGSCRAYWDGRRRPDRGDPGACVDDLDARLSPARPAAAPTHDQEA